MPRAFDRDPEPSAEVQAPPDAAHTNLPADEPVWAAARRAYVEEGASSPVVAERHGLNERTVRRRAAVENWPGLRAAFRRAAVQRIVRGGASLDEAAAENPDLEPFAEIRAQEVEDLLFRPTPETVGRFAFRRAAEFAGAGRVAEAQAWMRLAATAARVPDAAAGGVPEADILRAEFLAAHRAAGERLAAARDELEDEDDAGGMSGCPPCPPYRTSGQG